MRGDGTSGLYRLSHVPLVIGSEKLRIESRDRFHTERVVESRTMTRFLDYSIDYERGELFFKEPVLDRDTNFNPVFIIVEYETQGEQGDELTAGGRTSVRLAATRSSSARASCTKVPRQATGSSRVQTCSGRSARRREFKAEVAATTQGSGSRRRCRTHISPSCLTRARAWMAAYTCASRSRGSGSASSYRPNPGTRKYGADGRVNLTDRIAVQAEAYEQEYLIFGQHARRRAQPNCTTRTTRVAVALACGTSTTRSRANRRFPTRHT